MKVDILPEPSDEEREAILAALAEEAETASDSRKPWLKDAEEP
jgi:hypothetical protein